MASHRGLSRHLFGALHRRVAILPEAKVGEEAMKVYGWQTSKEKR